MRRRQKNNEVYTASGQLLSGCCNYLMQFFSVLKLFAWVPYISKVTQKILIFEKK